MKTPATQITDATATEAPPRFIVILNPKSGSAITNEDFRPDLETALLARGADYEIRETLPDKGGDILAREAAQEGATHVLAAGGDGTIMAVINGLAGSRAENPDKPVPTLAIVPGGTANLVAAALGLPSDMSEAVRVAVQGEEREIDLGRCGPWYFALGIGVGLTERLVSQASAQDKEKLGKWAYAKAMLKDLGVKPVTFTFKLDGRSSKRVRGVAIVVANSGSMGGNISFAPKARMDDGRLDLCILHRFWVRDLIRMAWNTLRGKLPDDRAVSFFQAKRIEVRSNPPLDSQIDGEVKDLPTPLVVEVVPRALKVRVPAPEELPPAIKPLNEE